MPAYASHGADYAALGLGSRIQHERQRQGLTLQQLSRRSHMSISRLSQIENEHHVLDTIQAAAIAAALGLPLEALLPEDPGIPYVITRDDEIRRVSKASPEGGELHHPLAGSFVGRHLEPLFTHVLPGCGCFTCHHEHEFLFVLQGTIELSLRTPQGMLQEALARGDSAYFRSSLPHRLRSADGGVAECIQVISSGASEVSPGADGWPAGRPADDDEEEGQAQVVGRELKTLRESRGWTIAQVARLAALEERHLRQIEDGRRRLPIDEMIRLARAFGKPLRELVRDARAPGPYLFVQRSSAMSALAARPRRVPTDRADAPTPNAFYPLSAGFPTRHMYPYLIRVRNMDTETLTRHEHHGEEFLYVLDGQLEVTTRAEDRDVPERLRAGDSFYLDASVPHFIRGVTRSPYSPTSAEVLDVFWCSLGERYLFELPVSPPASARTAMVGSQRSE
ncbi:MAG TPA: cupin domain-containing protein [Vicinamibacterales bacterium]|nr:cupin domain-containing protein [Vicinamibacterales bacterium]